MMRWKTVFCCCTLLLLCNQACGQANPKGIFDIPAAELAQNLSSQFSSILSNYIGSEQLAQAFEGAGIFENSQMFANDAVTAVVNAAGAQRLYDRIIELFTEAFGQTDQQIVTTEMFPQDFITECCNISDLSTLRQCCHLCKLQSQNIQNYLINVASTIKNGSNQLFTDFNNLQVRFEFAHSSGVVLEEPAINVGALGSCTVRSALIEDWYNSTLNSSTRVVIESVRTIRGEFFLSIAMASNQAVARALINAVDLFTGIDQTLQGRPSSYWLLLNSQGEVVYHPQLPIGRSLSVTQLETDSGFRSVLSAMTRSESDFVQFEKSHLLPLGPIIMHGYRERLILSTYIYQPVIRSPETNLSICVILAEEDRAAPTIVQTNPQDIIGSNVLREPFYHCSFATGATIQDTCSYYCQSASKDALSVFLTDPSSPVSVGSVNELVTSVNLYLENGGSKPDWIQDGVATEAARASVALNSVWTGQADSGVNGAVSWRYAAFPSGLLLNHPAIKIDQNLQLSHLPWYNRALAHPGLVTLSPAVADPRKTGLVYSISKAIYLPKTAGGDVTDSVGGPVLSVIAGDISLSSLHVAIINMEPLCAERNYSCFLVDSAGMIIYHPNYITEVPGEEPRHFAHFHPAFYTYLVQQGEGIVEKKSCNDYTIKPVNVSERSFSTLKFSRLVDNKLSQTCDKYQIARIPNTNAFLAITYSPDCNGVLFCACRSSALLNCATCPNVDPPSCDCPCSCQLNPNNALSGLRQCPAGPTERTPSYNFQATATNNLEPCYDQDCRSINNQDTCNSLRECTWCFTQCTRLADCCEDNQTSILPNCIQSVCRISVGTTNDDVSAGAIAGAVVGVIFVVLVIGCLILVLVWYNFIRKEDPNAPKQENEFDFSKSRSSSDNQSQEPLSKKTNSGKTDSKLDERDSGGATIVTPDTIQLSNPLFKNDNANNKVDQTPTETHL